MEFSTTTDMVRHYCAELLEDGKEHTLTEIRDYVNQQTGQRDINGSRLMPQHIYSALYNGFERCGRGVYKMISADPSMAQQAEQSEAGKLLRGLNRMETEFSKAFYLNYCDVSLANVDIKELHNIAMQMRILLQQAKNMAAAAVPAMETEPAPAAAEAGEQPEGHGMVMTT